MRLFLLILTFTLSAAAAHADRVALVIGNSAYLHTTPLPNAATDAADMADRLGTLGFTVFGGRDLGRRDMLAAVEAFAAALGPDDLALFYYAGHGAQIGTENHVIPVDAQAGDAVALVAASIRLQTILRTMELRADRRIVILDACRNNPFVETLASRSGGAPSRGLARVEAGVGSFIAFSTQPGNVALDGSGRNSPFTAALLRHIGTPDADIHAMMRRVRADVVAETGSTQVPWENSSLVDEVYLAAGPPPAPNPPVPTQPAPANPPPLSAMAARIFDPRAGGAVCYLRSYSADHLARHPDQRVTRIAVAVASDAVGARLTLDLHLATRGSDERLTATAYCDDETGALICAMEGDAGSFGLAAAKDGAIRLEVGPQGMRLEGGTGPVTLRADQGDDRVFLLPPNADCGPA